MAFKPPQDVLDMAAGEQEVLGATAFLRGEAPEIFTSDNLSADPQFKQTVVPYKRLDWQDKLGAAFNQNSPLINWNDARNLEYARNSKQELDVPDDLLKEGIPQEFLPVVLNEKYENGGVAALTLRDQIKDDVANKRIMDNLEWYSQLGYSAGGFLLDPTTYLGGAGAVKTVQMAGTGLKSLNLLSKTLPNTAQKLAQWGSVGAVESAALNAPKLSGDHTYTYENYQTDVLVDMLLGAGLTYAGSKLINKFSTFELQRGNRESAVVEQVKMMDAELNGNKTPEADIDIEHAVNRVQNPNVATRNRTNIRHLEQTLGVNRATDINAEFPQLKRGDLADKIDAAVAAATKDNDTMWLSAKLKELSTGKYQQVAHPAFTNPTVNNFASLINELQNQSPETISKAINSEPVEIPAVLKKVESGESQARILETRDERLSSSNPVIPEDLGKLGSVAKEDYPDVSPELEQGISKWDNEVDGSQYIDEGSTPVSEVEAEVAANQMAAKQAEQVDAPEVATQVEVPEPITPRTVLNAEIPFDFGSTNLTTANKSLNWLSVHAKEPAYRAVAKELMENIEDIPVIWKNDANPKSLAHYVAKRGEERIEINRGGYTEEALTHELIHAVAHKRLELPEMASVRSELGLMASEVQVKSQKLNLTFEEKSVLRSVSNNQHQEFLTYSLTSPIYQGILRKLDEAEKFQWRKAGLINRLGDALRKLLGVAVPDGYMDRAIALSTRVIKAAQSIDMQTGLDSKGKLALDTMTSSPETAASFSTRLLRNSYDKLTQEVADYHGSGEHKVYKDLLSPSNIGQTAARAITQWGGITRDLATTFIESGSPTLNYIGTHLTEMGRGYGGDVMRKHTAGVIRESEYIKSVSMIMPDYDKAVKAYAASKGSNAVGQMMAATSVGGRNKLQAEFAKEFMIYMNNTRRGRDVDNPLMADFAQKWNAYMRHNYKQLESNNIAGFTGDNKRNNYVPQVWNIKHAQRMVRNEPEKVRALLTRATGDADKAEHLIEWFTKQDSATYDGYVATNDSRALERMEVDWDVEVDGLSVLDLLETDTRKLATAYSNRVAGWVGVSKATNGKVTSYTDLNALKTMVWQETGKGKDVEVVNDVIDLLFGRPVKGGLPDYARSMKAAAVLTRLGSLGSAQLIESGTVATRAIMETMGDPKFMAKLTKGMSPKETAQDLLEIQKLTGNAWDFHLINTEAEYWTEFDLANTSKLQNQVDWAVDKATFGSAKQVAGRAFGHVTGYNQVRRFQAQMVQRSFAMQTARYFKHGESKLSVQRMADFGLTDAQGRNDILKEAIERHVEFDADGYPSKYNFDRWSQDAKDSFMYSMQRAEATELMRPLIGEMPEWFNKPWVQMVMQFRSMPLVAQNKSLGRSLAFADKEAVYQLVLNAMTSGLVRYGKFAGLAALATAGGGSFVDEYNKKLDNAGRDAILGGAVDRYITQGGLYSDVYALSTIGASANTPQQYLEKTMGQIPALGLVKDYAMTAYRASEGDGDKALNHAMRIIPLGNTLALEATATLVEESVEALE